MADTPPSAWIALTLRSSIREMESHRMLPPAVRMCRARCPMANLGSVEMLMSSGPLDVELILVAGLHLLQRGPPLTLPPDVLPLVLAHGAAFRRSEGVGVLNAAGEADEF